MPVPGSSTVAPDPLAPPAVPGMPEPLPPLGTPGATLAIPDPQTPFGLRTVDGSYNNIIPGRMKKFVDRLDLRLGGGVTRSGLYMKDEVLAGAAKFPAAWRWMAGGALGFVF